MKLTETTIHQAASELAYWQRARTWAWRRTEIYSLWKALPPLVAALAQRWIFDLHPMSETLVIAATVLGGYVFLYALEFLWKMLVSAPVALDSERQQVIGERDQTIRLLTEGPKRTRAEERYYQEAKAIVADLPAPAKQVVRHIWEHEKLSDTGGSLQIRGLTSDQVRSVLDGELATEPACRMVRKQIERTPHRTVWWEIVPVYRTVLGEILHAE
jgi:hypothetical protein